MKPYDTYIDSLKKLSETLKSLQNIPSLNLETSESFLKFQTQNEKIKLLLTQFYDDIATSQKEFQETLHQVSTCILTETYNSFIIQKTSAKIIKTIAESTLSQNNHKTDDYITVNEDSVKEFQIPDTIAIPIGHNRVRIKTESFIKVLWIILTTLIEFSILVYQGNKNEASETYYQEKQIKLKQEENQVLRDFLESIDASMSSKAKTIEELKESILTIESSLEAFEPLVSDIQSDHPNISAQKEHPVPGVSPIDSPLESTNTESEK